MPRLLLALLLALVAGAALAQQPQGPPNPRFAPATPLVAPATGPEGPRGAASPQTPQSPRLLTPDGLRLEERQRRARENAIRRRVLETRPRPPARRVAPATRELARLLAEPQWRRIQEALNVGGFDAGAVDGVVGPRTRAAIRRWQRANGHQETGLLTPEQARQLVPGIILPAVSQRRISDPANVEQRRVANGEVVRRANDTAHQPRVNQSQTASRPVFNGGGGAGGGEGGTPTTTTAPPPLVEPVIETQPEPAAPDTEVAADAPVAGGETVMERETAALMPDAIGEQSLSVDGMAPDEAEQRRANTCLAAAGAVDMTFPVPRPSTRVALPRALVEDRLDDPADTSLVDVAAAINSALNEAGYGERAFFALRKADGEIVGFSMVTRLERIRENGEPFPGDQRFLPPGEPGPFSLLSFVRQLFLAPVGYYRVILFTVSSTLVDAGGPALTPDGASDLLADGSTTLAGCFHAFPFTDRVGVDALVYEFRHLPEGEAEALASVFHLDPPGRIEATTHLRRAGLLPAGD